MNNITHPMMNDLKTDYKTTKDEGYEFGFEIAIREIDKNNEICRKYSGY